MTAKTIARRTLTLAGLGFTVGVQIGVLLVFAALSCAALVVLGEFGFATPGLALLLAAATVAGLAGTVGVVAYLAKFRRE